MEQTNESWRILIVEDDERLADLTREYLENNGLTVSLETHGGAAVERIRNEQPDLVVLDLNLPDGDGMDLCQDIRSASDIPIIMVTARGTSDDTVRGLERGADDYLAKPIVSKVLLEKISEHLKVEAEIEEVNFQKTTPEHNKEPEIIDVEVLEQLKKYADETVISSIFEEFEIEAKGLILDSINAEKTSDITKILSNLHTLKGNAGTLGVHNLESQAKKIETDLKDEKTDSLKKDLNDLLNYFNKFTENYQSILQ